MSSISREDAEILVLIVGMFVGIACMAGVGVALLVLAQPWLLVFPGALFAGCIVWANWLERRLGR